jgi:hypothetical protein
MSVRDNGIIVGSLGERLALAKLADDPPAGHVQQPGPEEPREGSYEGRVHAWQRK